MMSKPNFRAGVENLLLDCGRLSKGDRLLILHEDTALDYYDPALAPAVAAVAQDLGLTTELAPAPFDPSGAILTPELIARMKAADRVLFLSRSGDQIRFSRDLQGVRPIMCYALDQDMLASGFGWASYRGFVALKDRINACLAAASDIRVTCPLGTDFRGPGARFPTRNADVTVDRFPMLVYAPVPAEGFAGKIVQSGFLVGTGATFYEPYGCPLDAPVEVHFDNTRLTGFEGPPEQAARARAHYARVGDMLGLDPFTMHSWHAGIHPGCAYPMPAARNYERWGGAAFGNPRLLHFHTCGPAAPGEISLNLLDPTITVDGVAVWENGLLHPDRIPGGAEILAEHPDMQKVFAAPARAVGQGVCGQLSGVAA